MMDLIGDDHRFGPKADGMGRQPQSRVPDTRHHDVASDAGGEILADALTVIETAKLSGLDPEAYLTDILSSIRDHDPARLDDLLPWSWKARAAAAIQQAA